MKSIDSVKKSKEKPYNRSDALNKSNSQKRSKGHSHLSEQEKAKQSLLWFLVGGTMVIVIIGWVFFLRLQVAENLKKGGGMQKISEEFENIVDTVGERISKIGDAVSEKLETLNTEANGETEKDKQIKELEEKVFPQFNNSNTNS